MNYRDVDWFVLVERDFKDDLKCRDVEPSDSNTA
jgi:hypothetical protein